METYKIHNRSSVKYIHCNLLRICIYELHVLKQDSGQDGLHTVQKQLKCMAKRHIVGNAYTLLSLYV